MINRYHLKEKKKNKNWETKIQRQNNSALNSGLAPECRGKPIVFGGETPVAGDSSHIGHGIWRHQADTDFFLFAGWHLHHGEDAM